MKQQRSRWPSIGLTLALAACGGGQPSNGPTEQPSASSGQVKPPAAAAISYYAAARFAEQASFGPTPALIAEIRSKGFEKWIDDQFALSASQINLTPFLGFEDPVPDAQWRQYRGAFPGLALTASDQLRTRVTWALSQFLVVSDRGVDLVATLYWINLLQNHGLGRYDELLYQLSLNPAMGDYLDNNQNRPKSAACQHCAPNENFARELMQLFTLGVVKLNPDGTPLRDAQGKLQETYTQRDVEELARVLTGWRHDPNPQQRPGRNWGNWGKPMVAVEWAAERDSGAKSVLGRAFPAAQSQDKDLRDAIDLLMGHQNIAPFVALRMIQHLVKSNPSPAYVGRVAAKFLNNGSGVRGEMKAVVKAVLLDAEARAGDTPAGSRRDDGKLREPFLHYTAVMRGLGCTKAPLANGDWLRLPGQQHPFSAESVFSFYAPTDRAPGSNLLAPEQRLVNGTELTTRLDWSSGFLWQSNSQPASLKNFNDAGCQVQPLIDAYAASPRQFNDWISERYFRGAMSPSLRSVIEQQIRQPEWDTSNPMFGAMRMFDLALTSPYFGVVK